MKKEKQALSREPVNLNTIKPLTAESFEEFMDVLDNLPIDHTSPFDLLPYNIRVELEEELRKTYKIEK